MGRAAQRPVGSTPPAVLARRLTDAGSPTPPAARRRLADVTVVIPVRDRADHLERCLPRSARRTRSSSSTTRRTTPMPSPRSSPTTARSCCAAARTAVPAPHATPRFAQVAGDVRRVHRQRLRPTAGLAAPLAGAFRRSARRRRRAADRRRGRPTRGPAGTRASAAASTSATAGAGRRRARGSPTCPTAALVVRRAALRRPDGAVFDPRCGSVRTSIWFGGCTRRAGGFATTCRRRRPPRTGGAGATCCAPVPLRHVRRPAGRTTRGRARTARAASVAGARPSPQRWRAAGRWSPLASPASVVAMTRTLRAGRRPDRTVSLPAMADRGAADRARPRPLRHAVRRSPAASPRCGRDAPTAALAAPARSVAGGVVAAPPRSTPSAFVLGNVADEIAYGAGVWTGCVRAPHRARRSVRSSSCRPLRIDARRS